MPFGSGVICERILVPECLIKPNEDLGMPFRAILQNPGGGTFIALKDYRKKVVDAFANGDELNPAFSEPALLRVGLTPVGDKTFPNLVISPLPYGLNIKIAIKKGAIPRAVLATAKVKPETQFEVQALDKEDAWYYTLRDGIDWTGLFVLVGETAAIRCLPPNNEEYLLTFPD